MLEGAGTIGGLLAAHQAATGGFPGTPAADYVYTYDANGNVGQVVNLSAFNAASALRTKYEYDPYGNRTNTPGTGEYDQPFRFSTKYWDTETGLYYYGYRYYHPGLGRWLSRDPVGESDHVDPHALNANNPLDEIDALGLGDCRQCHGPGSPNCAPIQLSTSVGTVSVHVHDCCTGADVTLAVGVDLLYNGIVRLRYKQLAGGLRRVDIEGREALKKAAREAESWLGTAVRTYPGLQPSGRYMDASKTSELAKKLGREFRSLGSVCIVIEVVYDIHGIATAPTGERVEFATRRALGVGGSLAGFEAGCALGLCTGPAAFVVSPLLGLCGAVAGDYGAEWLGDILFHGDITYKPSIIRRAIDCDMPDAPPAFRH